MVANAVTVGIEQARPVASITRVCVSAGVVLVSRKWLKIAGKIIGASTYLVFIADAIAISIVQACAFAVVIRYSVIAVSRIRGVRVVIARLLILATKHLVLVAYAVVIVVKQAIARTIVPKGWPIAGPVVIACKRVVVASRRIEAPNDFVFVANAIAISIV